MRRVALGGIAFVMAAVLTGCPSPLPPGYQPPVVESVDISPQPAQPGDTLTVSIEARDDMAITGAGPRLLFTPSGTSLSGREHCTSESSSLGDPVDRRHMLITVTCTVPDFASNGTWQIEMLIGDGTPPTANWPGLTTRIPFEVVGGTDDRVPPQLVHYEIEPAVVDQETTFTLTMRLRDEALPLTVGNNVSGWFDFAKLFSDNSRFTCKFPSITPVSPTEVDVAIDCVPNNFNLPGRAEPGVHRAYMPVSDSLGHKGNIEMFVDVQPVPAA